MLNKSSSPVVGIDLGTTHSLVAYVKDGRPQVLNTREGKHLLPSIISFLEGEPVIGYAAKKKKVRDAEQTIFSVKRLLGRGFEDLKSVAEHLPYEIVPGDGLVRIRVGDRLFTAIEISAMILKELRLAAEQALGGTVNRAVVTVPAYFNDAQRQATRAAGRLAGWDVLRIVNEPTAAALAYGLDKKKQGLIAVYDLGGGTFDISILKLHDGVFEVLATHGDTALGGDDLDQALVEQAAQDIQQKWGVNVYQDIGLKAALIEAAEAVKIQLASNAVAHFEVSVGQHTYRREWTVEEFNQLVAPILERSRLPCMNALQDAGLSVGDLSDVVVVGGPTRLKVVQDLVRDIFKREPNTSMHPDEVVAEGAAIQADILSGNNRELLLLDVVPLSLGLETYGGVMSPLIPRNTRIPTVARETFTTFVDRQTGVDIHVLQGERERVEDNRSLARFKLKGIQPMPAGMPRIEVVFLIDADGILQVSAKDQKTGQEQMIEVRPSFGLTDAEVDQILSSSAENAAKDIEYRRWVEAKNDAEPVLRAVEKSLPQAQEQLSVEELQAIQAAVQKLKEMLKQENAAGVRDATSQLNQVTVRLAELLIKETLAQSEKNS